MTLFYNIPLKPQNTPYLADFAHNLYLQKDYTSKYKDRLITLNLLPLITGVTCAHVRCEQTGTLKVC